MKVIVIGCGRMGSGLARTLDQGGHAVTVVDVDPAAFGRLGSAFGGRTVAGGGTDRDTLLSAGIERADGLAAVTSFDEVNIVAARIAQRVFRVPRVAARLFDPLKADIYGRLGLSTIAPVTWGIRRMADLIVHSRLDTVASLGSGEVDVVEAEAPHLLEGRTAAELTIPGETGVVAITRAGRTFLPAPGTVIAKGDILYLLALGGSKERLGTLLGLT